VHIIEDLLKLKHGELTKYENLNLNPRVKIECNGDSMSDLDYPIKALDKVIVVRYKPRCHYCNQPLEVGERVVFMKHHKWAHPQCLEAHIYDIPDGSIPLEYDIIESNGTRKSTIELV